MPMYSIATDSKLMDDFEAENIAAALARFGAPPHVNEAIAFELWLTEVGGYGWIEEDDIVVARVAANGDTED